MRASSEAFRQPFGAPFILALVMAGGYGTRLGPLTRWQSKPALPFGGQYRNIDFTLSNCINSGLRRIAVLTQYKSHTLIQHVHQAWGFLSPELDEFCELWPAQQRTGGGWYAGTADAVYQNVDLIEEIAPEHVLVLAGDHIYKMDYRPMIQAHAASGAELTVACTSVPRSEAHRFGIVSIDAEQHIRTFCEKPSSPPGLPDGADTALASMGIYVFSRKALVRHLIGDAANERSSHDFGRDVLPEFVGSAHTRAYLFSDPFTGAPKYWRDVGTLDGYWQANMDLLAASPGIDLHDRNWPIRTHNPQLPPSRFLAGSRIDNSIIAAGCRVGGFVIRSILFNGAQVAEGACVEQSLVLPGARVGRNCIVRRAIIDCGYSLEDGAIVDTCSPTSAAEYVSESGISLMSRSAGHAGTETARLSAA